MNEELQYLRAELNQRLCFFYEHSQKTINMVLFAWGGILVILGATGYFEDVFSNILAQFIIGIILLVSNLMLYFSTRKGCDNVNCISRIESTIKNKQCKNDNGDISCLEIINNLWVNDDDRTHIYTINSLYAMLLMILSTLGIIIFTVALAINMCENSESKNVFAIISLVVHALYILSSVYLLFKIYKYTSLKYIDRIDKKITMLSSY